MVRTFLAGILLAAACPLPAAAQQPPVPTATEPDSDESTVEDIVVLGRPTVEQARAYVGAVSGAPVNKRLATWDRRICPGVTGLDDDYAQFLIDRISAVAFSVGVNPGQPGCLPDVLIAFTRTPDVVAQAWVADDLDLFRPSRNGGTDLGAAALERFKTSDAPVRWWHVSLSVNAQTGVSVTRTDEDGPVMNLITTPSLIQSPTRERLVRAFIVVDAAQIGRMSFGSLGDYLAFVALAQVDPRGETEGFDTILNLTADEPGVRLSDWDFDYLQTLYRLPANPMRASSHERQLARALAERQSDAETQDEP